jgi:hypothetical protein
MGISFASFEEAYLAAFEGARDMWLELLRDRKDPRKSSFEVCDEQGDILFILPFSEVLESCIPENGAARERSAFSKVLDASQRARRNFSELQSEFHRVRAALKESRELLSRADLLISGGALAQTQQGKPFV